MQARGSSLIDRWSMSAARLPRPNSEGPVIGWVSADLSQRDSGHWRVGSTWAWPTRQPLCPADLKSADPVPCARMYVLLWFTVFSLTQEWFFLLICLAARIKSILFFPSGHVCTQRVRRVFRMWGTADIFRGAIFNCALAHACTATLTSLATCCFVIVIGRKRAPWLIDLTRCTVKRRQLAARAETRNLYRAGLLAPLSR